MRINDTKNQKFFLGDVYHCYKGFSNDFEIKNNAASGGFVSHFVINLLQEKIIDGAVLSKLYCKEDGLYSKTIIATNRKEVIDCEGSIYFDVEPLSIIDDIKKFKGKLAFIGLPCHINRLNNILNSDNILKKKIIVKIGLFCGHNSKKELIKTVLEKKRIVLSDISNFRFRKGHWRGRSFVKLKEKKDIDFPFNHFSTYQNLHFFSLKKCMLCTDHTAENADISCGDIWLKKMRKLNDKYTLFISRNIFSDNLINNKKFSDKFEIKDSSPKEVISAQRRSLIAHKIFTPRVFWMNFFNMNVSKKKYCEPVMFYDYIWAFIMVLNCLISEKKIFKKIIFFIPRKILFIYLLLFKIFTQY